MLVIPKMHDEKVLTVSSINPNTDALDRIVLSIKLSKYVTKRRGRRRLSTLRNTREAITGDSSGASCASAAGATVSITISRKVEGLAKDDRPTRVEIPREMIKNDI